MELHAFIHNATAGSVSVSKPTGICTRSLVKSGTHFSDLGLPAASDNTVDRFLTSLELRLLGITMLERFVRDLGAVTIFY